MREKLQKFIEQIFDESAKKCVKLFDKGKFER